MQYPPLIKGDRHAYNPKKCHLFHIEKKETTPRTVALEKRKKKEINRHAIPPII